MVVGMIYSVLTNSKNTEGLKAHFSETARALDRKIDENKTDHKDALSEIKKNLNDHIAEDGKTHNSLHRRIDIIEREGCARGKDRR